MYYGQNDKKKKFQVVMVTDPNICGFGFKYILGIIFNM